MSRRAPSRTAHAHRRVPDAPAALVDVHPLTPLSERERRRWRPGRRLVGVVLAAIGVVAIVPMVAAALAATAPQLQPLAGGVAGAVSQPSKAAIASGRGVDAPAVGTGVSRNDGGTSAVGADTARGAENASSSVRPPRVAEDIVAPSVSSLTGYRWPLDKGRISLPFKAIPGGEWINDGTLFHDGVDMASFCGAPVRAAHDGVVLAAGRRFDDVIGWVGSLRAYYHRLDVRHSWGNLPIVIVIDDGNGYRSVYAHFRDVTVGVGQVVRAGELIGHEGATGHASGCHVHYGLFSPLETRTFGVRPDILRHLAVPKFEIARIDPLAVLPGGDVALRTRNIAKGIAAASATAASTDAPRPTSTYRRLASTAS